MTTNTMQTGNPGNIQADRPRWVELADSPHFAKEVYYHLSVSGYAIVPARRENDGSTIPKVKIKNRYLQKQIADINNKVFNDAPSAFAIVDNMETKFLFIDLDLHKPNSLPTHEACYNLGIDKRLYYKSMFQARKDGKSVHLLFRLDDEMLRLFREDQKRAENNQGRYFTTEMKTKHDERIPLNVELKIHSAFGNVRLKPEKRLYLKSRDEFPLITNFLKSIVLDIMSTNKDNVIQQKQRADEAAKKRQAITFEDLSEEQERRCQKGIKLLNGCLNDIKGCTGGRWEMINKKTLKVAHYAVDGGLDQNAAYDQLLNAAFLTGYSRKKCIDTVRNAWAYGLANPAQFELDDNWKPNGELR